MSFCLTMAKVKTMLRNVFLKSLREQQRSLMFWGIAVAALSLVTTLFYPSFKEVPEFRRFLRSQRP